MKAVAIPAPEIAVSEWARIQLPQVRLTPGDRALAQRVTEAGRLELLELKDGLQVNTRGWIGVLRLESCTIRIEPRLIEGHRVLVELLDYVRRLGLLKRLSTNVSFEAEGTDLFDLMAWLLAIEADAVLRAGVQADYVAQHDELTLLRGRMDFRAQVLGRFGRLERLVCDFDERVREIPENRWLVRALRLARRGGNHAGVSTFVKRTAAAMEELCEDDSTESLEKPTITRTNRHYRDALELAYLIIDGVTTSDLFRHGRASGFSFMMNMARLFEEFVSRAFEQLLANSGIRIIRQAADSSILWDPDSYRSYGQLRPDLLITRPGSVRLPIDAKYKDYDTDKLQPGDVYQAAIYALAIGSVFPTTGLKHALLVHPAGPGAMSGRALRVQVRVDGAGEAEIQRVGVRVAALLTELRQHYAGAQSATLIDALSP